MEIRELTTIEKLEALVRRAVENGLQADVVSTENGYIVLKTWKGHRDNSRQDAYRPLEVLFDLKLGLAQALFGEEEREWLGKYSWYSLYEQDGYTFKDAQELLDSWIYQGGDPKPTTAELEDLPEEGIEVCAGMVERRIETTNIGFRHHLQQAVISDDPIDYMYKAVFDE